MPVTLCQIPFMPVLEDTSDGAALTMMTGFFSEEPRADGPNPGPHRDPSVIFKRVMPFTIEDAEAGQICSRSGFWCPGHDVVWVDGKPYSSKYAPAPQRKIGPLTGGDV